MDLILYIALIILAFVFLFLGIYSGSYGGQVSVRGNDVVVRDPKTAATVALLLISSILFGILAPNSLNIEDKHCENQVLQSDLSGNTTTYNNEISCITNRSSDESLGFLFSGFVIVNIILGFIYIYKNHF